MAEELEITLKPSKGDNFAVKADPAKTILEFKQTIAVKSGIPAEEQRLIFKGQLLKDENTLASYGPSNGVVIHLVRGRSAQAESAAATGAAAAGSGAASAPPATAPAPPAANNPFAAFAQAPGQQGNLGAGMNPFMQQMMGPMAAGQGGAAGRTGAGAQGYPDLMGGMDPMQMMNNPMVQQMMQQLLANPQLMQQLMQSPMMQQMMTNNPMMNNPQLMQQMMDPQYMQMMAQMMGMGAGAGVGAGIGAGAGVGTGGPGAAAPDLGLGALAGLGGLGGLGALGGMGPMVGPPPPNARELYATQLQQMREMGFPNDEANLAALHQCGGSVTMAVDRLLQGPP